MLTTVEGVYRNGQIDLTELPDKIIQYANEEIRVLVTFLSLPQIYLALS